MPMREVLSGKILEFLGVKVPFKSYKYTCVKTKQFVIDELSYKTNSLLSELFIDHIWRERLYRLLLWY